MPLLLKNTILNGSRCDIRIKDGIFDEISPSIDPSDGETVIDSEEKIIIPSFKNAHTHSAMTLLRGWGDDMKLKDWLEERIWPMEEKIAEDSEACYSAARFACIEMIKSGTTFVNDMYFNLFQNKKAFEEMGLKASIGEVLFDFFDSEKREKVKKQCLKNYKQFEENRTSTFCLAPHSVYTVSGELLKWTSDFAADNNIPVHIHLAETRKEVDDCLAATGKTPAAYLKEIGFLGPNVAAAHCVWLTDNDIEILADYGVSTIYNPVSNMKLGVGNVFPYKKIKESGIPVMLGTDGTASNNGLNMMEEMKAASLLQKHSASDPRIMEAEEIFRIATGGENRVFPNISGKIEEGADADCLLLNSGDSSLIPSHNLVSNIVYSAERSCIDTVISGGRVLMKDGVIEGEKEIIRDFIKTAEKLIH